MRSFRFIVITAAAIGAAALPIACSDSGSSGTTSPLTSSNSGTMVVRLTDAPGLADEVSRVDVFVVRVDARTAEVDSAGADHDVDDDASESDGWKAIASPKLSFNLLSLQNGATATLGQATIPVGTYSGFRLIIDPVQSSVTLKDGTVLTGTSSPGIKFPSASKSGIKILLSQPVSIVAGTTTSLLVDFNVDDSFVMRGNTIGKNGLLFKPVIHASIVNLGLTNATIQFVNATGVALNLLHSGSVLSGANDIAFGASSACTSVNAATPALSVVQVGSTTPLIGFAPVLTVGNTFSIIAFPVTGGAVHFVTLPNAFTPVAGQVGLRVFDASTAVTGFDAFVTAPGAPLGTPTVANVLSGLASPFISVPAGSSQIRLTSAGGTTVLLDLGSLSLTAGKNVTLVIAPPLAGSTIPRAFLFTDC